MIKTSLNCGITVMPDQQMLAGGLLSNGFTQNVLFQFQLLELMGHKPFLLSEKPPKTGKYEIKGKKYEVRQTDAAINGSERIDIAFEGSLMLGKEHRDILKNNWGTKIVSLRYGNSMIMDMENIFVGGHLNKASLYVSNPDMVWTSPHFIESVSYMETTFDSPVRIAPYIWEPQFVTKPRFESKSYLDKPKIQVMESNIHVMKNALIPMTIIERVFREDSDLFDVANIYNSLTWHNQPFFLKNVVTNMRSLESKANKTWFYGRDTFENIFQQPDILLSHQWQCELNYLYLEALHCGVPLVHNSPPFEEVGYYYPRFDVKEGADQVIQAIQGGYSKMRDEQERKKIDDVIHRYSINNPQVQKDYLQLLDEVMSL